MKKITKVLVLVLLIAFTFALVGCGNDDRIVALEKAIGDFQTSLSELRDEKDLLLASHIKPWSVDVENRLNPQNGLCLSALYDRAFDKGLISFDERYRVILSQRLKQHCTEDYFEQYFGSIEGKVLNIPFEDYKPNQLFLEYHRDCILQR